MKKSGKVIPDDEDFVAVKTDPKYANKSPAEKYRLAQATKLIRLYEMDKKFPPEE